LPYNLPKPSHTAGTLAEIKNGINDIAASMPLDNFFLINKLILKEIENEN
jgi:hypothetical protein